MKIGNNFMILVQTFEHRFFPSLADNSKVLIKPRIADEPNSFHEIITSEMSTKILVQIYSHILLPNETT